MAQKLIKIGTSTGITIPKRILDEMKLKAGDTVTVEYDKKRKGLFIVGTDTRIDVERELLEWTDSFIEKYRPALDELAKK